MTHESLRNMMAIPTVNGIIGELSGRAGRPEFRDLVKELAVELQ